jgi:four helix bundle protein
MDMVQEVYRLSGAFPAAERFALTQQIRRAAVSVPSNIAEGHASRSKRDYLRLAGLALGSLAEVETQLLLAQRLGFAPEPRFASAFAIVDVTGRLLRGLIQSLERASALARIG